ncbi:MAG: 16S rRNA (guanine(966)-N(2))-methyltransferase RsmD [Pseudomonadota bacterium]
MRVIAGTAKGRKLVAPKGIFPTRPVLDKVKGAIFNILFDVTDLTVLDLFAGTGAIGIEALSRGAKRAVFVDNNRVALASLKKNIQSTGFENSSRVIDAHVARAIKMLQRREEKFDLIFIDPPYEKNLVNTTLSQLAETSIFQKDAIIIIEHSPKEMVEPVKAFALTETRKYGQTRISFLKPSQQEQTDG